MRLYDAPPGSPESGYSHSPPATPQSGYSHSPQASLEWPTESEDWYTAPPSPGSSTKSEDFHTAPSSPGPDSGSDPWSTVSNAPNTESQSENIKADDTEMKGKATVERRISGTDSGFDTVNADQMELRSAVVPGP